MEIQPIIKTLLHFVEAPQNIFRVIKESTLNKDVAQTFITCLKYVFQENKITDQLKVFEIESIVDFLHDELNSGHWSEVPLLIRQCFTCACFAKCLICLKSVTDFNKGLLKKCLECIDMGLLLGAPLGENEFMTESGKYLSSLIQEPYEVQSLTTKRKLDDLNDLGQYGLIKGNYIETVLCPSLENFSQNFFKVQVPVKIQGCMNHWPASTKWLDVHYLLSIAGNRTVPIEIGSHYTDNNWSQKLMTLKEFITKHYLSESGDIGYLAQHNLFEQITELKEDICIPEYCCLSLDYENATEPDINAWFGPKGTVSPLHYDPKNNILAQVYGTKQLLLFSPEDTVHLYPHEERMLFNTSQVDPLNPNLEKFPNFLKSTTYKCLLEPGEMLFIPEKWWHHVTALNKSFSVSFWWQ